MIRHVHILRVALTLAFAGATASAEPAAVAPGVPAKRGFTLADLKAQIPQHKDGTFLIEITDILNTATDPEVQNLIAGQPVESTGQVMPETVNCADGKRLRIFR